MDKENSKKKIVQDVIPRGRSIRNIELPSRARKEKPVTIADVEMIPAERQLKNKAKLRQSKLDTFAYEYEALPKKSKKWVYIALTVFVVVVAFGVSALFKSAEIKVTPKQEAKTLDTAFTAKKDGTSGDLGFQLVTVSKDVEKTVAATSEQTVSRKAQGTIIIYNNYSSASQKLVATTRFETPEGLIYRLISPVTVPGTQTKAGKVVAGSVEAVVAADAAGQSYNIGLKDFTIPGFKGDPKYTKVYARSKAEMTGGFSGKEKVVSKEVMDQANVELETILKEALAKDVTSVIPENFVLYEESMSYALEPVIQAGSTTGSVVLRKKGVANGIIFDKGILSRAIFTKASPGLSLDVAKITNLEDLDFAYASGTSFNPNTSTQVSFTLRGAARFVWVFDENKLKSDLLGLSKKNAETIIATYPAITEAWITTRPFWSQAIPLDSQKVTLINTLAK